MTPTIDPYSGTPTEMAETAIASIDAAERIALNALDDLRNLRINELMVAFMLGLFLGGAAILIGTAVYAGF